jgi:hypothetical protein
MKILLIKIETDKHDRRLNFHRNRSEISAYAEEYYKFKPKAELKGATNSAV